MPRIRPVNIPNEALDRIMAQLPPRHLVPLSRVCRGWQISAFPHLYHTVTLTVARHLELLCERALAHTSKPLSVRGHVQCLVFEESRLRDQFGRRLKGRQGKNRVIAESDLDQLVDALPQLRRLEHFSWELAFIPVNENFMGTLQENCPSLQSIHWEVSKYPFDQKWVFLPGEPQWPPIFGFGNLTRLSLDLGIPKYQPDVDLTEHIAPVIHASPNIESINLDIGDDDMFALDWPANKLLLRLGDHTFPHLHTFRVLGTPEVKWNKFFESPSRHPLWLFFSRHPQVHTVGFGTYQNIPYDPTILTPELLPSVWPSLRHFEGPAAICAAVVASTLTNQLESLTVVKGSKSGFVSLAGAVVSLPRLQKLVLDLARPVWVEDKHLRLILRATSMLEELELGTSFEFIQYDLIKILLLTPNLRFLGVPFKALSSERYNNENGTLHADPNEEQGEGPERNYGESEDELDEEFQEDYEDQEEREWPGCVPFLAEKFPGLRLVKNMRVEHSCPAYWHIWRDLRGEVCVKQSLTVF